jgi:DNA-binding transcriptional regulator/RsmH inhibitor MraZ
MSDVTLAQLPEAQQPAERPTFQGVHDRKITSNNQVSIPDLLMSVIKDSKEKKLVLMRWLKEPFLRLYVKSQFNKVIDSVKSSPDFSAEERNLAAAMLSKSAVPIQPDSQCRFVLPAKWVNSMNFAGKVVFCGLPTYIEVWPAQAYRDDEEEMQKKLEQLGPKLTHLLNS